MTVQSGRPERERPKFKQETTGLNPVLFGGAGYPTNQHRAYSWLSTKGITHSRRDLGVGWVSNPGQLCARSAVVVISPVLNRSRIIFGGGLHEVKTNQPTPPPKSISMPSSWSAEETSVKGRSRGPIAGLTSFGQAPLNQSVNHLFTSVACDTRR